MCGEWFYIKRLNKNTFAESSRLTAKRSNPALQAKNLSRKIIAPRSLPLASHRDSIYKGLLSGDVAQLGERRVRNAEARGSIPLISTRNIKGL